MTARIARIILLLAHVAACSLPTGADELRIDRIDPPNWWVGMKHNEVQLMLYGEGLEGVKVDSMEPRLQVRRIRATAEGHYAFVDVVIPPELSAGEYRFRIGNEHRELELTFPVLGRNADKPRHQGFDVRDTIYLITPDRFANGDLENDRSDGMLDEYQPDQAGMRHGGDLRGIIDRLDYLQELGVTALWLNPVLENRGVNSYHGYKATDLYRIDPRLGSNETYRELVQAAHDRGLKVIFDHVSNHIGIRHPWLDRLPTDTWFNGSIDDHLTDRHFLLSLLDPHADPASRVELKTFWFVDRMPDLNQQDPFLSRYLIQNSIWWIEYAGIDGIREDTYPYADQKFLTEWAKSIRAEYPNFNIVGEVWATKPAYIAHFQQGSFLPDAIDTRLPTVMDFPLMEAYRGYLDGSGKLRDVHAVLSQDFLYADTSKLLVFLDNHDTARAMFKAGENPDKVRVALTLLLTGRGIPQLLYGTEIGMIGGASHVELRADFPGGFPSHTRNAFTHAGRTASENAMYKLVQSLLRLRREHRAITHGKLIHYAPTWNDDTYMFVRSTTGSTSTATSTKGTTSGPSLREKTTHRPGTPGRNADHEELILVVANGNHEARLVDLQRAAAHVRGRRLKDLLSGEMLPSGHPLEMKAHSARVFLAVD